MIKVTICGSTKFKSEIRYIERELTMRGIALYSMHIFHHTDGNCIRDDVFITMRNLHVDKIYDSDFVVVIAPDNYIGEWVKSDIETAKKYRKHIYIINDYCNKDALDNLVKDMKIRKNNEDLWY